MHSHSAGRQRRGEGVGGGLLEHERHCECHKNGHDFGTRVCHAGSNGEWWVLSRVRLWFVLSPIEEGNRQRIEPSVDEESPKFHDEAASFFLMCVVCLVWGGCPSVSCLPPGETGTCDWQTSSYFARFSGKDPPW